MGDSGTLGIFKQYQSEYLTRPNSREAKRQFLLEKLTELNLEVYEQRPYNIYSYLRAPRGYGNECNMLAFPIDSENSILTALTYLNVWQKEQPQWLAKDVIVLFYQEGKINKAGKVTPDYSKSVAKFLSQYYLGHDVQLKAVDKMNSLESFDDEMIHGRCGYIRQGFPLIVRDMAYNRFLLHTDGVNGKLSDIDYLSAALDAVRRHVEVSKEISGTPAYFRKAKWLNKLADWLAPQNKRDSIREQYLDFLE